MSKRRTFPRNSGQSEGRNVAPGRKSHQSDDRTETIYSRTSTEQDDTRFIDSSCLCDYCGDDFLTETNFVTGNNKIYHESCVHVHSRRCKHAAEIYKKLASASGNILRMAICVSYLYGLVGQTGKDKKRKKEKRERKLRELCNKVSALRNSASGHLIIHVVGLSKDDNFFGYFDEFADEKLNNLIRDGSLYTDVYEKQRMSDCDVQELKEFTDFLVLYVEGASFLTTSELKTKLPLDDRIIDATDTNVANILRKKTQFKEVFPVAKVPGDLKTLQESRSVQVKGFFPSEGEPDDIVTSLLQKHRLPEYVSAFTKLSTGGSFFYGLKENDTTYDTTESKRTQRSYKSKDLDVQCVPVSDCESVLRDLRDGIQQSVLVCDYDGKKITDTDLVKVYYIPSCRENNSCTARSGEEQGHFVIQISVKPVSGIVFFDKEGPVAYRVVKDSIQLYTVEEWFRLFLERPPTA